MSPEFDPSPWTEEAIVLVTLLVAINAAAALVAYSRVKSLLEGESA